jgi:hypothetical protein
MYCSDYRKRLEQAIAHYQWPFKKQDVVFHEKYGKGKFRPRKIKTVVDLIDAIENRATTEKELRSLFGAICTILEPAPCRKTHCSNYGGSFNWCNCGIGLVPGRCRDNLLYMKRQKEKKARQGNIEERGN